MQFIPHCVCFYLTYITSSLGNVVHTSQYRNKLRNRATDIEKIYRKDMPSESELTEA